MNSKKVSNLFTQADHSKARSYEIKLDLTAQQISEILDDRLGQIIERESDDFDNLLNLAEQVKPSNLSDAFCQLFATELSSLLTTLMSAESDSYEVINFQHRMLRAVAEAVSSTKTA
ncbi:MAG: hypothetical protein OEY29_11670 [Gammaproteobacteria bacterium]|nr:hypothetical protein [Gammaproteobacteria bacterium]